MAARIFLALVGLIAIMWFLTWYRKADADTRNRSLVAILLYAVAAILLILVIAGRLPWLFALFSAVVPWINRALMVRQLWSRFGGTKRTAGGNQRGHRGTAATTMSREEALEILGLDSTASEQDIIDAHKKLIQRIHPDKGGSSFLAAQINQAKDTLLGDAQSGS